MARSALNCLPPPTHFQYRVMACVYPIVRLPEGVSEEEAIRRAMEFIEKKNLNPRYPVAINYPNLKTIWITHDSYRTDYYEPRIKVTKRSISFPLAARPGTVTIGGREIPPGLIPTPIED